MVGNCLNLGFQDSILGVGFWRKEFKMLHPIVIFSKKMLHFYFYGVLLDIGVGFERKCSKNHIMDCLLQ